VFEGCGLWVGAHTAGRNSTSFGVSHVGNYETQTPTDIELRAHGALIAALKTEKALRMGAYPTGGHRDTKATACPGARLYAHLDDIRTYSDSPPQEDEDDMNPPVILLTNEGPLAGRWYAVSAHGKTYLSSPGTAASHVFFGQAMWGNPTGGPGTVSAAYLERVPDTPPKTMLAPSAVEVDEAKLAAEIAKHLPALSDADVAKLAASFATANADELHRRTAS
jgi:hypothetical protein